jgi:hypothetical protein
MILKIKKILNLRNGQVMAGIVLLIFGLSLFLVINYFNSNWISIFSSYKSVNTERVLNIAEAGIQKALFEINKNMNWSGTQGEVMFGDGSFEIFVYNSGQDKVIESIGYYPNKSNYKIKKRVRATLTKSSGASSFHYASQGGFGGVELNSNAIIYGNVYSNSYIDCDSNSFITGDGFAVSSITPSDCPRGQSVTGTEPIALPDFDRNYWISKAESGGIINGDVSYNSGINYLGPKRINGNLTVNTNATLVVTGPIYVTGNVSFNSNSIAKLDDSFDIDGTVILADGTIYMNNNSQVLRPESWGTIRPDGDYTIQWSASPGGSHWSNIDDLVESPSPADTSDYIFSSAANKIDEFNMQTIDNATSVSQMVVWVYARNTASSSGDSLGVNLIVDGSALSEQVIPLTTSFSWASSTFSFSPPLTKNQLDNIRVRLREVQNGSQDSVQVAGLYAKVKYIKQNAGYLMFVSDKANSLAIELNGNSVGGIYYARFGILQVNSNSHPVAITAYKLILNSNAEVRYDEGLPSQSFVSGPGGGWAIKPGTFIILD